MIIKDIFFDLDRTLWDFEKNSQKTLLSLIDQFNLSSLGVNNSFEFINKYKVHNERLWNLYRINKIKKSDLRTDRFLLTLKEYSIFDDKLAEDLGDMYVKESPLKKELFPFTLDVLAYLHKKYKLHIITNGFDEVQHVKLKYSNLDSFFNCVITSEKVGFKKPNRKIFEYALNCANANPEESVMIGDDLEADILGAQQAGMHVIFFNPQKKKYDIESFSEISCLSQLFDQF